MTTTTTWTSERARIASLSRSRPEDDPDLVDARQQLRVIRLSMAIRRALEQTPPLTPEQRAQCAALLVAPDAR